MASKETIKQHIAQSSTIDLKITPVPNDDEVIKMSKMEHIERSIKQKG